MKKALMYASVASMIDQFNMENIRLLKELGYSVDVACNFQLGNNASKKRIECFKEELSIQGIEFFDIPIPRKFSAIIQLLSALRKTARLFSLKSYDIIHCHSPIGSVIARIVCLYLHKRDTFIIYTAHGFHFYKGASLFNWLVYYPIEKFLSNTTDSLITINTEDFEFAKKTMKAKRTHYLPGIGINCQKFQTTTVNAAEKKMSIGVPSAATVLLSVGELNKNKNHEVIMRALAELKNENVHYIIAGIGKLDKYLLKLSIRLGIKDQVHLIGFRTDIPELLKIADIFCFPSYREGMPVSLLEAMASGLPTIASRIRGVIDCSEDGVTGFLCSPSKMSDFYAALRKLIADKQLREEMGRESSRRAMRFDRHNVNLIMRSIYSESI